MDAAFTLANTEAKKMAAAPRCRIPDNLRRHRGGQFPAWDLGGGVLTRLYKNRVPIGKGLGAFRRPC